VTNSLTDAAAYELERREVLVWRIARQRRISRRTALKLAAATAGAAWGLGVARPLPGASADPTRTVKPTPSQLFYDYGSNAETRFEALKGRGYLTPNSLFFVRNTTSTPIIDATAWRWWWRVTR
jgi:sulfane dehydrogenase subunit SoxC